MDFHFLIRNGIAGGIFLALLVVGIWVESSDDAAALISGLKDEQSLVVATIAAATPVIGICLQSLLLLYRYSRRQVFTDTARRLVADRLRDAIRSDEVWSREYSHLLNDDSLDDRLFVSLYHRKAPQHLIEWARRRRSYDYLGWTCFLGAVLGLLAGYAGGLLWRYSAWHSPVLRIVVVLAAVSCWSWAALHLAVRMKRDADEMELAWAIYELTPELQKRIEAPATDAAPRRPPVTLGMVALVVGFLAELVRPRGCERPAMLAQRGDTRP